MRILRVLLAFALVGIGVVSTVGSGGGGGNGIDDAIKNFHGPCCIPSPDPVPTITIDNAQDVSATVVQAIDQLLDLAAKIGGQIFPSPPAASDLLFSHSKFEFVAVAASEEPVTVTCAVSGTVRVYGYPDNDPVTLSTRDAFGLIYDSCDDGDGYTLDGRMDSIIVDELEGDPRTDVFRITYRFSSMSPLIVTAGADSYLAASSGQRFILKWDSLAFPVVVLTATPGNLQLSTQAGADSWYWLSDQAGEHSLTVNADISIPTTRVDARESQMYSDYFGDISYEIIVPLQAPGGQDPESGEIMISGGSGNVTIHIVIESSVSVRLEIDADGDGTVDDYHYTTWSALRG